MIQGEGSLRNELTVKNVYKRLQTTIQSQDPHVRNPGYFPYFRPMKHVILLPLLTLATVLNAQQVFQINDFGAAQSDLNILGSAAFVGDRLRLTPARTHSEGACWYKVAQIDIRKGFETEFTFLVSEPSEVTGDGFAFIIQDQSPSEIGGTGDAIGYKGIPHVMAIEFDTKNDNEGSKNHINLSFYEPATKSYRRYATVHEIPEITDGRAHFTKMIYRDGNMEVYLDSYLFPVLSVRLDIASKIGADDGTAWVGFTSATSEEVANHDLIAWTLREYLPDPEDIDQEKIEIIDAQVIQVKDRKLRIRVWDHNRIDGDIVSLKWGEEWIANALPLKAEPSEIEVTLHGFNKKLILFANNVGMVPPNTAMISVFDGQTTQYVELNADMAKSEALVIQYVGE